MIDKDQEILRAKYMATRLTMLPEECVTTILCLTSPSDACRSMLVSLSIRSAAESDTVWGGFLPYDLPSILSRSHSHLNFSSKRELFLQLCDSILIDGGITVSLYTCYF